jgi:hypothetical protein
VGDGGTDEAYGRRRGVLPDVGAGGGCEDGGDG